MERIELDNAKCKNTTPESVFTGRMLELLGIELATIFVSALTFSIAYPWMLCWKQSWYADHTHINGKQMRFDGTGGQLIGSWVKWILLTIITLGIYLLWLPLKVQQWTTKHTFFEGSNDKESKFTGSMLGLWGVEVLGAFVTICTLGIAWPWVWCWQANWYREHTIISGKQLLFSGKGSQFLGNWLKWMLLIFVTFGIYGLWFPIRIQQWAVKHTHTGDEIPEVVTPDQPDDFDDEIKICPKCKKAQDKGAAFCRFCGTLLGERKATASESKHGLETQSESHLNTDQIKKNRKVICPHCGARHIEGTTKCKYCGTLFDGNKSVSHIKKNGKIICPHCGARQKEDAVKCKYCGTPIQ